MRRERARTGRNATMSKAMIITVGTGRDRQDIAGAIRFSIRQQNPDFVRFLVSEISEEQTLPLIVENADFEYDSIKNEEVNDVERIYLEYVRQIEDMEARGFHARDIVADYTSGTKAMSAALLSAAIAKELGAISYICGERDSGGRVIKGMERPMSFAPIRFISEKAIVQAKTFFNAYRFESAIVLCDSIEKSTSHPAIVEETVFLKKLAAAYDFWDRFDFASALKYLGEVKDSPFLQRNGIKGRYERNKQLLFMERENKYCYERVVDLIANAERRFTAEGRYDDGVARLYRAFEYLAQVRLFREHGGIQTESLGVDKLPGHLRDKYTSRRNESGKIQISLVAGYELLSDMNDDLGRLFMNDLRDSDDFKVALRKRNSSILAHGFTPIGKEDALKLMSYIEKYIVVCLPSWAKILGEAEFPKLKV